MKNTKVREEVVVKGNLRYNNKYSSYKRDTL